VRKRGVGEGPPLEIGGDKNRPHRQEKKAKKEKTGGE